MYLSHLRLWNFRKFGSEVEMDIRKPNLDIPFNKGLNLLIGENDSGKSAIIDAIKLVFHTHSREWIYVDDSDFYKNTLRFRVECELYGFSDSEAKNLTEWLCWYGTGEECKPYLRVFIDVKRNNGRILPFDLRAGNDEEGTMLSAEVRELLKITYLKPLRDAGMELAPRRNSRLSQILQAHDAFKDKRRKSLFNWII